MVRVVYYVACSVDGFIASPDGGVEWLSAVQRQGEDYGYAEFFASVDSMVMGSRTYEQVLGFGNWPYGDTPCWVLSRRSLKAVGSEVSVTASSPVEVLTNVARRGLRRLWLVGGSHLAGSFMAEGRISECIITVIPVLLGDGMPLFSGQGGQERLDLVGVREFSAGVVSLLYGVAGKNASSAALPYSVAGKNASPAALP
jgi:dihydrofolate reductase